MLAGPRLESTFAVNHGSYPRRLVRFASHRLGLHTSASAVVGLVGFVGLSSRLGVVARHARIGVRGGISGLVCVVTLFGAMHVGHEAASRFLVEA